MNLAQRLKEGALARRKRDLRIAEEWFLLEEEVATKYLNENYLGKKGNFDQGVK